jgi:hypothetical protein
MATTISNQKIPPPSTYMRASCLLLTIVTCGALTMGLGLAGEQSRQPSGQGLSENHTPDNRPSGEVPGHPRGNRNQVAGKSSKFGAESRALGKSSPSGLMNSQPKRTTVTDLHQNAPNKAATVPAYGPLVNGAGVRREQIPKLPSGKSTTTPSLGLASDRSAHAATIGGLAASSAKHSTAVITGTGMKRKP